MAARPLTKAILAVLSLTTGGGLFWRSQYSAPEDRFDISQSDATAQSSIISPVEDIVNVAEPYTATFDGNNHFEPHITTFDVNLAPSGIPSIAEDAEYVTVRLEDLKGLEDRTRFRGPPNTDEQWAWLSHDFLELSRLFLNAILKALYVAESLGGILGLYNWVFLLTTWAAVVFWWILQRLGFSPRTRSIATQTDNEITQTTRTQTSPPPSPAPHPPGPPPASSPSGPPSSSTSSSGPPSPDPGNLRSQHSNQQSARNDELERENHDLKQQLETARNDSRSAAQDHANEVSDLKQQLATTRGDAEKATQDHANAVRHLEQELKAARNNAESAAQDHADKVSDLEQELATIRGDAEKATQDHANEVNDLKQELATTRRDAENTTQDHSNEVRNLHERAEKVERENADLSGQVTNLTGQMNNLTGRNTDLTGQVADLTGQNTRLAAELETQTTATKNAEDGKTSLQQELDALRNRDNPTESESGRAHEDLRNAQQAIQDRDEQLSQRDRDIADLQRANSAHQNTIRTLESERDQKVQKIEEEQRINREHQSNITSLQNQVDENVQKFEKAQRVNQEQQEALDSEKAQKAREAESAQRVQREQQGAINERDEQIREQQKTIEECNKKIQELESQPERVQPTPGAEVDAKKDDEIHKLKEQLSALEEEVGNSKQRDDEISKLKEQVNTLNEEAENLKQNAEAEKESIARQHDEALEKEGDKAKALQEQVDDLQESLSKTADAQQESAKKAQDLEQENAELQKQIENNESNNKASVEAIEEVKQLNRQLQQERDGFSRQVEELTSDKTKLEADLQQRNEDVTALDTEQNRLNEILRAATSRINTDEQDHQNDATTIQTLQTANNDFINQINQAVTERNEAQARANDFESRNSAMRAAFDQEVTTRVEAASQQHQDEMSSLRSEAETRFSNLGEENQRLNEENSKLQARVKVLEDQNNARDTEMELFGEEPTSSDSVSNEQYQQLVARCADLQTRVDGYHATESELLILRAKHEALEEDFANTDASNNAILQRQLDWENEKSALEDTVKYLQQEVDKLQNADGRWDDEEIADDGEGLREKRKQFAPPAPPESDQDSNNQALSSDARPKAKPRSQAAKLRRLGEQQRQQQLQLQEQTDEQQSWNMAEASRSAADNSNTPFYGRDHGPGEYQSQRRAFLEEQEARQRARNEQDDEPVSDEDEEPAVDEDESATSTAVVLAPTANSAHNPLLDTNEEDYPNPEDFVTY